MRTTRSGDIPSYWPLAVAAVLVLIAAVRAYGGGATHEPLPAEQVTAELARTVSYGLIDAGSDAVAPAVRRGLAAERAPEAS